MGSDLGLTPALTSLPAITVKTTAPSEDLGLIAISPALAGSTRLALGILPPLNLKTTAPSEVFGVTIISPALAKPRVTSNETTTAASDVIFAPAYRIQWRSRCGDNL